MKKSKRLKANSEKVTLRSIELKEAERAEIEAQTKQFLESGGEIQSLPVQKRTHIRFDPCNRVAKGKK